MSRASSGELDNTPIVSEILELRREEAQLLGFDSFAQVSLSAKMAPHVAAVEELLEDLRQASWDAGVEDLEQLRAFAAEQGAPEADDLQHWDVGYWAERLREARYEYRDEEVRPYFPMPTVLEGCSASSSASSA